QSGQPFFNRSGAHGSDRRHFEVLHIVDDLVEFLDLEFLDLLGFFELVLFLVNLLDDFIDHLCGACSPASGAAAGAPVSVSAVFASGSFSRERSLMISLGRCSLGRWPLWSLTSFSCLSLSAWSLFSFLPSFSCF